MRAIVRWVEFKDALPSVGEGVLLVIPGIGVRMGDYRHIKSHPQGGFWRVRDIDGYIWECTGEGEGRYPRPTHWCYPPDEPPFAQGKGAPG